MWTLSPIHCQSSAFLPHLHYTSCGWFKVETVWLNIGIWPPQTVKIATYGLTIWPEILMKKWTEPATQACYSCTYWTWFSSQNMLMIFMTDYCAWLQHSSTNGQWGIYEVGFQFVRSVLGTVCRFYCLDVVPSLHGTGQHYDAPPSQHSDVW